MQTAKISHTYPKVCIIVLYCKDVSTLIECLSSLGKVTYPNFNVIIVNNGSKKVLDLTTIQQTSDRVLKIINSPFNVGFARGNNLGIREALLGRADYVLLLNDDTVVSPDFLNSLVATGEGYPDIGMLGPKVYYFDEPCRGWFTGARFDEQTGSIFTHHLDKIGDSRKEELIESDYITGCALLVKRRLIDKIGLLDERFFLYCEDVDWGLRSKKANFKDIIVPASKIWHKISISSGGPDSPLKAYHKTRSHLLLTRLHAPDAKWGLIMRFIRDIAWLLIKSSDPDRIKKAMAYLTAIIDYHLGKTGRGPHWLWTSN